MIEDIDHCGNFLCAFNCEDNGYLKCRISASMPVGCIIKGYFDTLRKIVDVDSICRPIHYNNVISKDNTQ